MSDAPVATGRPSANTISNFETIIHLLKGNIGIGVLTLPMAIRNSGLMLGSAGLIFIAVVCIFCMRILVASANKVKNNSFEMQRLPQDLSQAVRTRPSVVFLDYADTAEACFVDAGGLWAKSSRLMSNLVNTFLILTQVGSNAVYVIFIAENIRPVSGAF